DDEVVVGAHTDERPGQQGKVLAAGVELDGGPREVPGSRQQVEVLRGRLHRRLTGGGPARDHVVDSVLWVCNADAAAGVGLRVEVDEQHAAPLGEGCSQVDGRRRLPYAALLVDHPDDGQALPPRSRNATRLPSRPRRRSAATASAAAVSAPAV